MFINGRKNWLKTLQREVVDGENYIWVHLASLGEFEQGRPIIESIKKRYPGYKIVITFFSPSGYEMRKNYESADIILYLPLDTPRNARKFVKLINPAIAIFVKYEFWSNFINELSINGTSVFLVSGIFREQQHFFKWYGGYFRKLLRKFTIIFVQDRHSGDLLGRIGIDNFVIAGDTRFDRVMEIAGNMGEITQLDSFRGDEPMLIIGSSWPGEEKIVSRYINRNPEKLKWVFAPHEIDDINIERLEMLLKTTVVRFSGYDNERDHDARVLIIDNIGILSSAYRYGKIAVIGGGFGKGIHNILEAACWGLPVMFGPNHRRFREAVEMKKNGAAISFSDYNEFEKAIDYWLNNDEQYQIAASASKRFVAENSGATRKIVDGIFRNR